MKSINYEKLITKVLCRNSGTILNIPVLDVLMSWFNLLLAAGEWEYVALKPSFAVKLTNLIKMYNDLSKYGERHTHDLMTDEVVDYILKHHIKDLTKLVKDADKGKPLYPHLFDVTCDNKDVQPAPAVVPGQSVTNGSPLASQASKS